MLPDFPLVELFAGPALADIWPALWDGQWTRVGKDIPFGLGAYRLDAA